MRVPISSSGERKRGRQGEGPRGKQSTAHKPRVSESRGPAGRRAGGAATRKARAPNTGERGAGQDISLDDGVRHVLKARLLRIQPASRSLAQRSGGGNGTGQRGRTICSSRDCTCRPRAQVAEHDQMRHSQRQERRMGPARGLAQPTHEDGQVLRVLRRALRVAAFRSASRSIVAALCARESHGVRHGRAGPLHLTMLVPEWTWRPVPQNAHSGTPATPRPPPRLWLDGATRVLERGAACSRLADSCPPPRLAPREALLAGNAGLVEERTQLLYPLRNGESGECAGIGARPTPSHRQRCARRTR